MTKWTLLLLLCLALLGQDRKPVKEREAELHVNPRSAKSVLRIIAGPGKQNGNVEIRPKALIETKALSILAA